MSTRAHVLVHGDFQTKVESLSALLGISPMATIWSLMIFTNKITLSVGTMTAIA
jgi:hypothetical protein